MLMICCHPSQPAAYNVIGKHIKSIAYCASVSKQAQQHKYQRWMVVLGVCTIQSFRQLVPVRRYVEAITKNLKHVRPTNYATGVDLFLNFLHAF